LLTHAVKKRKGPSHQAARLIISQARSNPDLRYIHAYPAVSNAASNAIARKIGMENQGEFDNEAFAGVMRCNDWRIDLRELDICYKEGVIPLRFAGRPIVSGSLRVLRAFSWLGFILLASRVHAP
jgi:hypothetical protein